MEGLVFGAEFVAMKHGVEVLRSICSKLRMMGVNIDDPIYIYSDNMSVINNTSKSESCLKKKSNIICYHFVCEAVATCDTKLHPRTLKMALCAKFSRLKLFAWIEILF